MANMMHTVRAYRPSTQRADQIDLPLEERQDKEHNIRLYQERAKQHLPLFPEEAVGR
jgi:hypothetical protein